MKNDIVSSRFIRLLERSRTMSSIYEIMMSDYTDTPASQWLDESDSIVSVSFHVFNEDVKSMAAFLSKKLGAEQQGCFVGLSMDNSHLWQVCFWALLMAGYKPVLIDVNHGEDMVDYIIESAGIRTIIGRSGIELKNQVVQIPLDELKSVSEAPEFTPQ